jgi:hypothetical protein
MYYWYRVNMNKGLCKVYLEETWISMSPVAAQQWQDCVPIVSRDIAQHWATWNLCFVVNAASFSFTILLKGTSSVFTSMKSPFLRALIQTPPPRRHRCLRGQDISTGDMSSRACETATAPAFKICFFNKKRLPGVGSEPGSYQFHLFSHFHHYTAEPQQLPTFKIC